MIGTRAQGEKEQEKEKGKASIDCQRTMMTRPGYNIHFSVLIASRTEVIYGLNATFWIHPIMLAVLRHESS